MQAWELQKRISQKQVDAIATVETVTASTLEDLDGNGYICEIVCDKISILQHVFDDAADEPSDTEISTYGTLCKVVSEANWQIDIDVVAASLVALQHVTKKYRRFLSSNYEENHVPEYHAGNAETHIEDLIEGWFRNPYTGPIKQITSKIDAALDALLAGKEPDRETILGVLRFNRAMACLCFVWVQRRKVYLRRSRINTSRRGRCSFLWDAPSIST